MYTLAWIDSDGEANPIKRGSLLELARHMRKAGIQFTRRDVAAAQLGERATLTDVHGRRFTLTYTETGGKSATIQTASHPGALFILAWEYERGATPKTVARGTAAQLVGEMKKRGIRATRQDFESAAADGATPVYGTAGKYLLIHRSSFVTSALNPQKAAAPGGQSVRRSFNPFPPLKDKLGHIIFELGVVLIPNMEDAVRLRALDHATAINAALRNLLLETPFIPPALRDAVHKVYMSHNALVQSWDRLNIVDKTGAAEVIQSAKSLLVSLKAAHAKLTPTQVDWATKAAAPAKRTAWHFAFTNPATGRYTHATADRINRLRLPDDTPLTPVFQSGGKWVTIPGGTPFTIRNGRVQRA